jgi:uncharacterized MAPEG superfamily protein
MTMPMAILGWSAFLGTFHALSTGVAALTQHGAAYSSSPRDDERPLSPRRARNARAFANFMQSFPFFAAAVLISHAGLHDHGVASWGAQIWFWARVVYVPIYISGNSTYRTPVYVVSLIGLMLVFLSIA